MSDPVKRAPRPQPLTHRQVASLKPKARRYSRPDGKVRNLALRVYTSGRKAFVLYYRIGRRLRLHTIGEYPTISLADARASALQATRALKLHGIDPAAAKLESRTANTFADLAKAYLLHAKRKKKSWAQDELMVKSVLLLAWKSRPVRDLRRHDVTALVNTFVDREKFVMANRVLALVHTMLRYGVREEWLEANVASEIEKQPETSRERVLTEDELRELWCACTAIATADPHTPTAIPPLMALGLQLQLVTAQRPGECFSMQWGNLELPSDWLTLESCDGWWTIPAAGTKNKRPHRVPLVPDAVALLRAAHRLRPKDNPFVFGGIKKKSIAAQARRKAMVALRRAGAITFSAHRHDLRRTCASGMGAAAVPRQLIAYVLNHVDRGVARATSVYDRFERDGEKRIALDAWNRRLTAILAETPADGVVVPFVR